MYRWKPESGEMEEIGLAAKTPNPSFLALSPNHNDLYCVNEQDHTTGNVSAFAIDHTTGKLIPKNVVPSGGSAPCNLTADHTGQRFSWPTTAAAACPAIKFFPAEV